MVGTADQARAVLNCMKYPPVGGRGVALGIAHDRYMPGPTLDKLTAANKRTTLFAQIETAEGVENADEIAAVDGVDCLWIGHFDLSCSLGIPGEFEHKTFKDAVRKVIKACASRGKALGRLVPTAEQGVALYKTGHDFICYSGDVWVLQQAVSAGVSAIREAVEKRKTRAKAAARSGGSARRGPAKSRSRSSKT